MRGTADIIVPEILEDHSIRRSDDTAYVKRYKRGRYLGKGGFAKCYELISFDSSRVYAGKIIPKTSLVKPSAKRKLLNEIKIHREICHPNVVKFERFFEDSNNVCILLELCAKNSLMELVKKRKRLTEPETQYYMWNLVQVMKHLHGLNIIHRDLKLGNLFLSGNMELKVGDFGLAAKLQHPEERKRTICGTPNYIAPEILDSSNGHSFEVDVWAMGVIMYTMLIGRPPFETSSVKSTYKRIRANSYEFPDTIPISSAAQHLISSILHRDPHARPTLDQMAKHNFFSRVAIPPCLPCSVFDVPLIWPVHSAASEAANSGNSATGRRDILGEKQINILVQSEKWAQQRNKGSPPEPEKEPSRVPMQDFKQDFNLLQPPAPVRRLSNKENAGPVNVNVNVQTERETALFSKASSSETRSTWAIRTDDIAINNEGVLSKPTTPREIDDNGDDDEEGALRAIHDEIERSFLLNPTARACAEKKSPQPSSQLRAKTSPLRCLGGLRPAELWVNKWVDYSNKYGLGYVLSNGNVGVYFNDSSKLILHKGGHFFEHIPRRSSSSPSAEVVRERLSLDNYPSALKKKVLLLQHFRNYLLNSGAKKSGSNENGAMSEGMTDTSADMSDGSNCSSPKTRRSSSANNMVYVKKWLRTKHAILFRLNDRTVQVIFYDHTEVVLSPDKVVTYTDKQGERESYPLHSVFKNPRADLAKRMKYTKEILSHLLAGSSSTSSKDKQSKSCESPRNANAPASTILAV